ncbi:DUF1707 domain-containing protein [Luteococcus peritonei]|uniref:DUF1707 domain-containing protein n=1 Tax=Luteococcus peritonei TaxID=88874 RepID=A0ABW4RRA1_9ACTN
MSNLPISSKYRSTPERPVDEAEREDLTKRLNEAFEAGTVSQDDYRALLDRVFAARSLGELVPVVEQLPAKSTHDQPELVRQEGDLPPGELLPAGMSQATASTVMKAISGAGVLVILLAALILLF